MKHCKITKVSKNMICYRGFYFGVRYTTSYARGTVEKITYYGLNAGMKTYYWNREQLKKAVDRRIDEAMKLLIESYEWETEDHPHLAEGLDALESASK